MKLNWSPKWQTKQALSATVEWYQAFKSGKNMKDFTYDQISHYESFKTQE
jgi:CDP-glucose 4,6-dehydratase